MPLKYKVFIVLYFSVLKFASAQDFHSSNRFIIPWSAEKKLTWRDFKGRNLNPFQPFAAVCEAQIMVIPFYDNGKLNINVISYFDQLKSWSKDTTSKQLLEHEQLHFNVTELYARKIRQNLQELLKKGETPEEKIYELIHKLFEERDQYNVKMDEATDYGTNPGVQTEWEQRVAKELDELKSFKIP
jgi:hypothetical protein